VAGASVAGFVAGVLVLFWNSNVPQLEQYLLDSETLAEQLPQITTVSPSPLPHPVHAKTRVTANKNDSILCFIVNLSYKNGFS
jgi:hypothetical protein